MARQRTVAGRGQAAWQILRSIAAQAQVYDARVLDGPTALHLGQELDASVASAARRITDGRTAGQAMQLQ